MTATRLSMRGQPRRSRKVAKEIAVVLEKAAGDKVTILILCVRPKLVSVNAVAIVIKCVWPTLV